MSTNKVLRILSSSFVYIGSKLNICSWFSFHVSPFLPRLRARLCPRGGLKAAATAWVELAMLGVDKGGRPIRQPTKVDVVEVWGTSEGKLADSFHLNSFNVSKLLRSPFNRILSHLLHNFLANPSHFWHPFPLPPPPLSHSAISTGMMGRAQTRQTCQPGCHPTSRRRRRRGLWNWLGGCGGVGLWVLRPTSLYTSC